jgi:sterol desaturase/sphingolipid hydroxylase (fatty acid hydroxylase superfamily)
MNENSLMHLVIYEKNVRLLCFLCVFVLMALWEWMANRREQKISKKIRWSNNLALALINALMIRVLFPGAALWASYLAFRHHLGLFNNVEVPFTFAIIFTIIFLDWVIYYQHRAFHAYPFLWKIHRMHHTDLEVDVTTGVRFHPLEMLISMLVKSMGIILLGAPTAAVFLFEITLNIASMFSHSNIHVPERLDKLLRFFIVTPDMHRIHHSANPPETNSNFGFNLSWWDRLLGTYRDQPEKGQEKMKLGLDIFDEPEDLMMDQLLLQPFLDKTGRFAFGNLTRKD